MKNFNMDVTIRKGSFIIDKYFDSFESIQKSKLDKNFSANISELDIKKKQLIATILDGIMNYGYTLNSEIVEKLSLMDEEEMKRFQKNIYLSLDLVTGINPYNNASQPMYLGFPEEVMALEEVELYFNSILHYLSSGALYPYTEEIERLPSEKMVELKQIRLGTIEDITPIVEEILTSKVTVSKSDISALLAMLSTNPELFELLDAKSLDISQKTILVSYLLTKYDHGLSVAKDFKTATDILRFTMGLCGADTSLIEAVYPSNVSIKRRHRKLIMELLNNLESGKNSILEDMTYKKNLWLTVCNKIHPFEYKNQYPKAAGLFKALINGEKVYTFNSRVEELSKQKDVVSLVEFISKRPGEFARKLDWLLRIAERESFNQNIVLNKFKTIAEDIPSPLLIQLIGHFRGRVSDDNPNRVFFPKTSGGSIYAIENKIAPLDESISNRIVGICEEALISLYSEREPMGNVYIDESLKNFKVPFRQRTMSETLRSMGRGSKVSLDEDTKYLRAFVYWDDPSDIDLSVVFLDKDFKFKNRIAYYSLRDTIIDACHSGDIVDGTGGAEEYVDINIQKAKESGIRYACIAINNYSSVPFSNMKECMVGVMEREDSKKGKTFEPSLVKNKATLNSISTISLPMLIDLEDRESYWLDISVSEREIYANNVDANSSHIISTIKGIINSKDLTLYDLAMLNFKARGSRLVESYSEALEIMNPSVEELEEEVENADEPSYIITPEEVLMLGVEDGVSPFDINTWSSEFM